MGIAFLTQLPELFDFVSRILGDKDSNIKNP